MVIPWKIFAFRKSNRIASRLLLDDGLEISNFVNMKVPFLFWHACVSLRVDYGGVGVCFSVIYIYIYTKATAEYYYIQIFFFIHSL